jgi:hypothetical protein
MTFHHSSSLYLFYALAFTTDRQKHFAPWSEIPLPRPTIIRSHSKPIVFMSQGFFLYRLLLLPTALAPIYPVDRIDSSVVCSSGEGDYARGPTKKITPSLRVLRQV